MNGSVFLDFTEKFCLTGSLVLCSTTTGYKSVVMKICPFRTSCRTDLKSLPMYIGIHNRMVIDLRKTKSEKATACKAGHFKE